ncbi:Rap1a/Tai family immunity protein [Hahella aquimaris]|uniref:Rap1a/Tai family immunity protein n=1 Tax=Hahella sp. HNIBRBA332 TaxID=3015983 RepID=UPI00352DD38F
MSHAERIATPISALHLYAACQDAEKSEYARGFCDGAIDALYSSMDEWCVPPSVTHGEVKAQVKKELLGRVPQTSYDALEFVKKAVHRKWPCP